MKNTFKLTRLILLLTTLSLTAHQTRAMEDFVREYGATLNEEHPIYENCGAFRDIFSQHLVPRLSPQDRRNFALTCRAFDQIEQDAHGGSITIDDIYIFINKRQRNSLIEYMIKRNVRSLNITLKIDTNINIDFEKINDFAVRTYLKFPPHTCFTSYPRALYVTKCITETLKQMTFIHKLNIDLELPHHVDRELLVSQSLSHLTNLQVLIIKMRDLNLDGLAHAIRQLKQLKSFIFFSEWSYKQELNQVLVESIAELDQLESLHLNFIGHYIRENTQNTLQSLANNIEKLKNLKSLHLDLPLENITLDIIRTYLKINFD